MVSANIPFHKNSVGGQKIIEMDNSTNSTMTGQGFVERDDWWNPKPQVSNLWCAPFPWKFAGSAPLHGEEVCLLVLGLPWVSYVYTRIWLRSSHTLHSRKGAVKQVHTNPTQSFIARVLQSWKNFSWKTKVTLPWVNLIGLIWYSEKGIHRHQLYDEFAVN